MSARLDAAYRTARDMLLAERHPEGYWVGELSSSALATATAVAAFGLVQRCTAQLPTLTTHQSPLTTLIETGLAWLVEQQNDDGGWGDTDRSLSNISTTSLCRSALFLATASRGRQPPVETCLQKAEKFLRTHGGADPVQHAEAIRQRYGQDRTFSVPILMTAALAGLIPWSEVPALPFELACFPQSWFRFLRMPVVSYALPALIAIGQAVHHHRRPWNPLTRLVRRQARRRSLRVLERIQPSSGGFLEATPLTSFVVMALASIGQAENPVVKKGVEFLINSVRPDGSWPIDSNLSVWVTTLSVNALEAGRGELDNEDCAIQPWPTHQQLNAENSDTDPNINIAPRPNRLGLSRWLPSQQMREHHPYTGAAPGGWGWTHLPGSVPDGDDTPGALLALLALEQTILGNSRSMRSGLQWLLDLQNRDGGWPTFCRGWGSLPFDRSGADLTAHALRAFAAYRPWMEPPSQQIQDELREGSYADSRPWIEWSLSTRPRYDRSMRNGLQYLTGAQRPDGSWLPLWFGNQHAPNEENPTYGTARVLAAYRDLGMMDSEPARRGVAWLLNAQNADGSWGGARGVPGSVEETALALEVLVDLEPGLPSPALTTPSPAMAIAGLGTAVERGLHWLISAVEAGRLKSPEPIGFYFAKLWYYEKLYPVIFAVAALGRARRRMPDLSTGG